MTNCPKCNGEDTLFDVYLEIKFKKDEYLHTLCCKCGCETKDEATK